LPFQEWQPPAARYSRIGTAGCHRQAAKAGIEPAEDVFNRHAQLPAVAPSQ